MLLTQYKNTYIPLFVHFTFSLYDEHTHKKERAYYDLSNSGAYLGPDKLDRVLKSNSITRIGKNKVRKWLHNQDDYSLRRELRHSVRKARVVVAGIDDQIDMDLSMCPISPMKMIVSDISSLLSTYLPNISGLNH